MWVLDYEGRDCSRVGSSKLKRWSYSSRAKGLVALKEFAGKKCTTPVVGRTSTCSP